jgi:hypothetical protein
MRNASKITGLVAASLLMAHASAQYPREEAFKVALGTAGLTPESARFDPAILDFYRQSEFSSSLFQVLQANPWRASQITSLHRRQLFVAGQRPIELISSASRMVGDGASRELLANPIEQAEQRAKRPGALRDALTRMQQQGLLMGEIPSLETVPLPVQEAASLVLETALAAYPYRQAAFGSTPEIAQQFDREASTSITTEDPVNYQQLLNFYRRVDMAFLYGAAQDLAAAATRAAELLREVPANQVYRLEIPTRWGIILLTGGSNTTHGEEESLLRIDTGGDDVYFNLPANVTSENWCSITIDTQGSDAYLSHPELRDRSVSQWSQRATQRNRPGPAAAAFGIALLVDTQGDDLYRTHRRGLGSAVFGAAILIDREGDDVYDAYADALGFGKFGVGIVDDLRGDDRYTGFQQVMGVGLPRGAGILVDRQGNDEYEANTAVLDFPSAQDPDVNASLAMGVGYGVRQDYLSGRSMSGGVGVLFDVEGNDRYAAGMLAQGFGFWEGVGMLWDEGGDDVYQGRGYVQGVGANFGIGILEDAKGSDEYRASADMAMGAGHDFGVGMLIEMSGNDRYEAQSLALGAGSEGGMGIFLDEGGSDRYISRGISLGESSAAARGSLRERLLTLGVFADLGGQDTYPSGQTWAVNGGQVVNWRERRESVRESQLGIFWDR